MIDPDDLLADLPAPRGDEPGSLRQDIADELADHLQSAARSERLRQGPAADDRAVWQAVLTRFGSPQAVARKLWWDAVKEKIMAQRLLMVAVVGAVLLSLGSTVLMWRAMETQQASMQAMLAQMTSTAAGPHWMPLRVKLISEEGRPVAGSVTLQSRQAGEVSGIQEELAVDAAGVADFGLLPLGQYQVRVSLVEPAEWTTYWIIHGPGRALEHEVICPTAPPKSGITFSIEPPEDLQDQDFYFVAHLQYHARQYGERTWNQQWLDFGSTATTLLLDGAGEVLGALAGPTSHVADANRRVALGFVLNFGEDGFSDTPIYRPNNLLELQDAPPLYRYPISVTLVPYAEDPRQLDEVFGGVKVKLILQPYVIGAAQFDTGEHPSVHNERFDPPEDGPFVVRIGPEHEGWQALRQAIVSSRIAH